MGGRHPWQLKAEDQLRDRPGVVFVHLLTDEIGLQWLIRGEIPTYLREQARDALDWLATDNRASTGASAAPTPPSPKKPRTSSRTRARAGSRA